MNISVEELARKRASGEQFVLLDVREPWEIAQSSLPESTLIPMRELPARLTELDPQSEIAVLCHHGNRSSYVTRYLRAQGFSRAFNVEGGIDAYSKRVDPSVARY